tara:strand:- start:1117 stop:1506 length:390 start_codon:yes stop_codon:yes gene_type:complete
MACQKNDQEASPEKVLETVSIAAARQTAVPTSGSDLKVELLSVNDSRCPSNAVCITAGTALLKFSVNDQDEKTEVSLNFSDVDKSANTVAFKLNGAAYELSVTEVFPYPNSSKSPQLEEYKVQVSIKRK